MIDATVSTVSITNSKFNKIYSASFWVSAILIRLSLDSVITVQHCDYLSSKIPFSTIQTSSGSIDDLFVKSYSGFSSLIQFQSVTNFTFSSFSVEKSSFGFFNRRQLDGSRSNNFGYIMYLSDSYVESINDFSMMTSAMTFLYMQSSQINTIENIVIDGARSGFNLKQSQINIINNLQISNTGSSRSRSGVFNNDNSNITMYNSIFSTISARYGACMYIQCDQLPYCYNVLENVTFIGCNASYYGGAIYYDIYRPVMANVTFSNNTAPYGPDIASYPVKLVINGTNSSDVELFDIASGQQTNDNIVFALVDYDNQTISEGVIGSVKIKPVDNTTSIEGSISQGLLNGTASFGNLSFVANPGSKRVEYQISSDTIDSTKIMKQFGVNTIQKHLLVNFRY